jgi:hypothetical protein
MSHAGSESDVDAAFNELENDSIENVRCDGLDVAAEAAKVWRCCRRARFAELHVLVPLSGLAPNSTASSPIRMPQFTVSLYAHRDCACIP